MNLRHECKHVISPSDLITLRGRLRCIMQSDSHAGDGRYLVRSLYFDDLQDTALREKLDGVSRRDKFRIRCYNGDPGLIRLEKKSKWGGLGSKRSELLSAEETQWILNGELEWMPHSRRELVVELYHKMTVEGLRPKTIVDYIREPFVFPAGNVRVTLDYDIRTGLHSTEFLSPDAMMIPVPEDPIILEVKWDTFLPDIIRDAVQLENRRTGAFSKYAACRVFG